MPRLVAVVFALICIGFALYACALALATVGTSIGTLIAFALGACALALGVSAMRGD